MSYNWRLTLLTYPEHSRGRQRHNDKAWKGSQPFIPTCRNPWLSCDMEIFFLVVMSHCAAPIATCHQATHPWSGVMSDRVASTRDSLLATCWHATHPRRGAESGEHHVISCNPPVVGCQIKLSAEAHVPMRAMCWHVIDSWHRRQVGSCIVGSTCLRRPCGPPILGMAHTWGRYKSSWTLPY
jgi:hypothetical protein